MATIYVPRSFGGTLIITVTQAPPPVEMPGTATITDKSVASSLLGNNLVSVATVNDQAVANATLTDKLG